jgi:hypothetical protein
MGVMLNIIACVCLSLMAIPSQTQGWRGIVPLHSTREDVERLIGPPMTPNGITYDLKNERVNITYSAGGCAEDRPSEWNVPPGTVIGITIYPQTKLLLSDLQIDLNGFEKFINPHNPDSVYYNNEEGVSIGTKSNGEVVVVQYLPSVKDNRLRCPNSSAQQHGLEASKFDEYSNLPLNDENARLDNLANYMRRKAELIGYIITYAGRQARPGEAKAHAARAKSYLVNERGIESERVVTMDGGRREKSMVELYVLPRDVSPPAATPTVNSSEAQVVKATGMKSNNRRIPRSRRKW